MPVIRYTEGATHELPGTRFTSIATPSLGSSETALWNVEIEPGTAATPHVLTREEIFVVLDGVASVSLDGTTSRATAGDAIAVPPSTELVLANGGDVPLRLMCCLPVGGQAKVGDGDPFTPPWAM